MRVLRYWGNICRVGYPHGENAQRHAAKSRRQQQRQPPRLPRPAQIGLPRKQTAVSGAGRYDAQAQIAHKHQQRTESAQKAVPPIGFQLHAFPSFHAVRAR